MTHFAPWIGQDSHVGPLGAGRLLLLGEAHYSDVAEDERPTLTNEILSDIRAGKRSIPYFTKLARLLVSLDARWSERTVWDSVCFYNYVQGFAATTARVRPTRAMWLAGSEPLARVLNELRPARVLVTGSALWQALSTWFMPRWTSEAIAPSEQIFLWRSMDVQQKTLATWINHPSSVGWTPSPCIVRAGALLSTSVGEQVVADGVR